MEDGIYKHRKKLIIVPDFANDEKEIFFRTKLKNHAIGMKEFSDIYHLGITDEKLGDENGELFSPHWADELAKQSHIVFLIDFIIILYIPTTLSNFQYQWLINQKNRLKEQEEMIRAIIYNNNQTEYISHNLENISKIDLIYQYIETKNKQRGR